MTEQATIGAFAECQGAIPELRPITVKVADVSDEERFPNIAAAIDHARRKRIANDG